MNQDTGEGHDARLLRLLEGLLAIEVGGLDTAMTQAAQRLAETLAAEKVDVLLHDPATESLVAVGTSDTPMGRREHELGLDVLPIANGGWAVEVLRSGRSHLARYADREQGELKGMIEGLGVRSSVNVPIDIAGDRRGVLIASSTTSGLFTERDLRFVEHVAHWIGLVAYRIAHTECLIAEAAAEATRRAAQHAVEVLTRRQQDVARLIGAGLTNEQIAQELVITTGTVANHVEAILRRLGFGSRVQVATWAVEWGLYRRGNGDRSDA
jgi:DNA-binding CsgD family transcriptional regulator